GSAPTGRLGRRCFSGAFWLAGRADRWGGEESARYGLFGGFDHGGAVRRGFAGTAAPTAWRALFVVGGHASLQPSTLRRAATFDAISRKARACGESGSATVTGRPRSPPSRMLLCSGTSPRKLRPSSSAASFAPPWPK